MPGDGFVTSGQWKNVRRPTLDRRARMSAARRTGPHRRGHLSDAGVPAGPPVRRPVLGTRAERPGSDKTVPLDHNEVFGPMQPANLVVIADHSTERAGGRPDTDVRLASLFDPCLVKLRLTGAVGRGVENPVTDLGSNLNRSGLLRSGY